jgi:SNF2 family DNA or RNA helicase
VVIHYDRWWNASKENQATDRVHRIGQERAVQVFKMITKGTLEEKINLLIARKQSLFDKFIERDEELFQSLSREDLIELLS